MDFNGNKYYLKSILYNDESYQLLCTINSFRYNFGKDIDIFEKMGFKNVLYIVY